MTGFGVQVVVTTWRRCPSCPRSAPVDRVSGEHFCAHYRGGRAVDIPTRCTPFGAHIDLFPRNTALQFSTRTAPSPVWPRPDGSALAIYLRFTRTRRSRGAHCAEVTIDQSVFSVWNFAVRVVLARVAAYVTSAAGLRCLQHGTLHPFHRKARKRRVTSKFNDALVAVDYALFEASSRPESQNLRRRVRLVEEILSSCPGGNLLDAGCGPGRVDRTLLRSRPRDFRITVLDQSLPMIEYCVANARNIGSLAPTLGRLERMPYANASFDVSLALGVLEYTDLELAVGELSRVTRPGGLVVVSMLTH